MTGRLLMLGVATVLGACTVEGLASDIADALDGDYVEACVALEGTACDDCCEGAGYDFGSEVTFEDETVECRCFSND